MQQTQDIITIKTMKRLLKCLKTEPVEIYPGYSLGFTLPPNTTVSVIKPISEILPLCTHFDASKLFVSFMVYKKGADIPMCEISWKKSGQYVYKNNQKFENPPLFNEIFSGVRNIFKENLATKIKNNDKNLRADIMFYRCQNLVLKYLMNEKENQ